MTSFSAFTTMQDKDLAEALGEALEELEPEPTAVGVIEIEDGSGTWEVAGYFTEKPDIAALSLLALVHGAKDFVVSEIPDTDWVAQVQRELTPVEAGRFFVYGSHDADKLPEDRVGLLIEAAMAFGTGHHATTQGCLQALDALAATENPTRIADIGAGTAVLAMGAARVWPKAYVIASDIDEVAVEVALANCKANNLPEITCVEAAGFDHPLLKEGNFDLIFANILKGPLIELAPDMKAACKAGGVLVLSGLLQRQVEDVLSHYIANDFTLEDRRDIGEWSALVLRAKA